MPGLEIKAVHSIKVGFYAVARSTTLKGFVFFKGCALIKRQVLRQSPYFMPYFFSKVFTIFAAQKLFELVSIKLVLRSIGILRACSYQHIIFIMKKAANIISSEKRLIEISSILAMGYLRYKKARQSAISTEASFEFQPIIYKEENHEQ